MKKILFAALAGLVLFSCAKNTADTVATPGKVKPGIEVLRDNGFEGLKGKRVGLITNPTGVDNNLKSTIDILHEADGVELVALFSPEHGVRGDVHAGDTVSTYIDPATGVTVYSIYGKTKKPTEEMMKDVDVLLYDIQDNGCRSYTFISTMGLAMEACADMGKEFMVLDRPNPVGGNKIEGCLVEDSCISFVSQFPIPYLYGLTPGELAQYLNEEGLLKDGKKVNLSVTPMEGYNREMSFGETGMPWVLPSPHLPNPDDALYYPVTGILGELYYVNIGIGYPKPFKLFGAEWINAQDLAERLNARNIPGIKFRPIHYKPFYSTDEKKNLQGVEVYITDKDAANLSLTQFYVMEELADMYPDHKVFENCDPKRFSMFDKVVGKKEIRQKFSENYKTADIEEIWTSEVEPFREASAKYHIYK